MNQEPFFQSSHVDDEAEEAEGDGDQDGSQHGITFTTQELSDLKQ